MSIMKNRSIRNSRLKEKSVVGISNEILMGRKMLWYTIITKRTMSQHARIIWSGTMTNRLLILRFCCFFNSRMSSSISSYSSSFISSSAAKSPLSSWFIEFRLLSFDRWSIPCPMLLAPYFILFWKLSLFCCLMISL